MSRSTIIDSTDQELADAWLAHCRAARRYGSSSKEADATFWAFEALDKLCSANPLRALQIVLRILRMKPEERILSNLAAGPLEDLLVRNGNAIVGQLEQVAQADPDVVDLLLGIWTNSMSPEIVEKLAAIVQRAKKG
jgi:hypothetical protein